MLTCADNSIVSNKQKMVRLGTPPRFQSSMLGRSATKRRDNSPILYSTPSRGQISEEQKLIGLNPLRALGL